MAYDFSKTLYTGGQLREKASEYDPFLVEDYILKRSLCMLIGQFGQGKTPFVMQLTMSIAAGIPFLGKYKICQKDANVIVVDFENGTNQLASWSECIAQHLGLDKAPKNWRVYSPALDSNRIKTGQDETYILDMIRAEKPDIITIDPLRGYHQTAESKNDLAMLMINKLRLAVQQSGSTVLIVHHPRKKPQGDDVEEVKLSVNGTEWIQNASGAGSLIQNTDVRIGFDVENEEVVITRRYLRGKGWQEPDYLIRNNGPNNEYVDPIGYILYDMPCPEEVVLQQFPPVFGRAEIEGIAKVPHLKQAGWLRKLLNRGKITPYGPGAWQRV